MLLIDLFGFSEIVVKCTSGEEMYEVASKAKKELNAKNHSVTIASVIGHTFTRESVWKNSDYKWIASSLTPELIEKMKYEAWNGELPTVTGGSSIITIEP